MQNDDKELIVKLERVRTQFKCKKIGHEQAKEELSRLSITATKSRVQKYNKLCNIGPETRNEMLQFGSAKGGTGSWIAFNEYLKNLICTAHIELR